MQNFKEMVFSAQPSNGSSVADLLVTYTVDDPSHPMKVRNYNKWPTFSNGQLDD